LELYNSTTADHVDGGGRVNGDSTFGQHKDVPTAEVWHVGEELLLWRTEHPLLEGLRNPGTQTWPTGSLLARDNVLGVTSFPHLIWATQKLTGEIAWNRLLPGVVHATGFDNTVCLHSDQGTVVGLDGGTGEIQWESRSPKQPSGVDLDERVAGAATVTSSRVFWTNANGCVTCADAKRGSLLWRTEDLQALPVPLLVADGSVIGIASLQAVFALDEATGQPLWNQKIPQLSPSTPLPALGGILVRLRSGVALLDPSDGSTISEWRWPALLTGDCAGGPTAAFAVLCEYTDPTIVGLGVSLPKRCSIARLQSGGSVLWNVETSTPGPQIVWNEQRRCLYETSRGLGLIEPNGGRRTHLISFRDLLLSGVPAIEDRCAYIASHDGVMVALQLPDQ
jgi:hypothetical protein